MKMIQMENGDWILPQFIRAEREYVEIMSLCAKTYVIICQSEERAKAVRDDLARKANKS